MTEIGWVPADAVEFRKREVDNPERALNPDLAIVTDRLESARPGATLNCRCCQHAITRPSERIEVNGHHRHAFTNPHGFDYIIGCFAEAPGITGEGEPTDRWTWFPGFRWQIGLCRGCGAHLGWRFVGPGQFHGLILQRLVASGERPLH